MSFNRGMTQSSLGLRHLEYNTAVRGRPPFTHRDSYGMLFSERQCTDAHTHSTIPAMQKDTTKLHLGIFICQYMCTKA